MLLVSTILMLVTSGLVLVTSGLVLTTSGLVLATGDAKPPAAPITFAEHIAPLVHAKCALCHRPGEAAPFSLLTYDDVKKRAKTIASVVGDRFMPPWHPDAGWGEFQDDLRLTDEQVARVTAWVEAGAPEGDPARTPPPPKFTEGWQLGPPDLVVTMARPYSVAAGGSDVYRNFVLPLELAEDRWVTAVEVRPSARTVVHHVLFYLADSKEARSLEKDAGEPGFRGMGFRRTGSLGGWAVGAIPRKLPDGLAMPLAKGSDLVLQTHFHPDGKPEQETTTVGLYFAKEPPKRTLVGLQLPPLFGRFAGLDIPAGEKHFVLRSSLVLPCDVDVINVGAHAHYLGRTMRATATLPAAPESSNGSAAPAASREVKLFSISDWDFNWQGRYEYARPLRLPRGTRIDAELTYDNSADNPKNPSHPPKRVRWGPESEDEMGSISFALVPADEKDLRVLRRAVGGPFTLNEGGLVGGGGASEAERWKELDLDGDGKIQRSEFPELFESLFDRIDANRDGALDVQELLEARSRRGRGERRDDR